MQYIVRKVLKVVLCIAFAGACLLLVLRFGFDIDVFDRRTVLVLCLPDTDAEGVYGKLAKRYMEQNEKVKIQLEVVNGKGYEEYLYNQFSREKAPDIFVVTQEVDMTLMANNEYLLDMSDAYGDLFDNGFLISRIPREPVWELPINGSIPLIFYNKDVFLHNNFAKPENMSDFLKLCAAIQAYDMVAVSMSVYENGDWGIENFIENIMVNGMDWKSGALTESGELNSGFYDLRYIRADLLDKLLPKERSVQGHPELLAMFANGEYAMISGTSEDILTLNQFENGQEYGIFALAGMGNSRRIAFRSDMSLAVSAQSSKQGALEDFMGFLLSGEAQSFLHGETGLLPVCSGVTVGEEYKEVYRLLSSSEIMLSFMNRTSSAEYAICMERINVMFSQTAVDYDVFMQDWLEELSGVLQISTN